MEIHSGYSALPAAAAVAHATTDWPDGFAPELIIAYASTKQDLCAVRESLRQLYPDAELMGCSTSGEHSAGQHHRGALALTAIGGGALTVATVYADDIATFDAARAAEVASTLFSRLGADRDELDLDKMFCLMLIDGLSLKEEQVTMLMADALEGVPLVGGSAGDDLAFTKTQVMARERAGTNAAAFMLCRSSVPIRLFKHQHFAPTEQSLVITRADVPTRRVFEMDGYPAADAYARALGLPSAAELTTELTFMHPILLQSHGEYYVRSIQKVEPDGSLVFYCGIEEGMVLDVARRHDIVESLGKGLCSELEGMARPQLVLGINCILRALEAEAVDRHAAIADTIGKFTDNFIAFDTYGEQLNGLHINQTLVGIAFGR